MSLAYNDLAFLLKLNSTVAVGGKEESLNVHTTLPPQETLYAAQV